MIDVWKDRVIFEAPIQAAIESRLSGTSFEAFLERIADTNFNRRIG